MKRIPFIGIKLLPLIFVIQFAEAGQEQILAKDGAREFLWTAGVRCEDKPREICRELAFRFVENGKRVTRTFRFFDDQTRNPMFGGGYGRFAANFDSKVIAFIWLSGSASIQITIFNFSQNKVTTRWNDAGYLPTWFSHGPYRSQIFSLKDQFVTLTFGDYNCPEHRILSKTCKIELRSFNHNGGKLIDAFASVDRFLLDANYNFTGSTHNCQMGTNPERNGNVITMSDCDGRRFEINLETRLARSLEN